MAVYVFGVTTAVIDRHTAFSTMDGSSEPSSTALGELIDHYAAELANALYDSQSIAASSVTAATAEDLYTACQGKLIEIVSARWIAANARESVDPASIEGWRALLGDVRAGRIGKLAASRVSSQIDPVPTVTFAGFWRKGMAL